MSVQPPGSSSIPSPVGPSGDHAQEIAKKLKSVLEQLIQQTRQILQSPSFLDNSQNLETFAGHITKLSELAQNARNVGS